MGYKELIIGDKVRVCRPWLHDKSRFIEGIIKDIRSEDISYHGSPCYEKKYLVAMADNTSKWMQLYGNGIRDMYISPAPKRTTIYAKMLSRVSELNAQMANENICAIARLIDFGGDKPYVLKDEGDFLVEDVKNYNQNALDIQKSISELLNIGAKLAVGDISANLFESDGTFQIKL